MNVIETSLPGVKLLQPTRFGDERGWFAEFYNQKTFETAGIPTHFVQDNQSLSRQGVLRGLHYQSERPQGKLVRVLHGHIWDVAVDIRPDSLHFGRHAAFDLKGPDLTSTFQMLWIPPGFAHGFLTLTETAEVLYKTTDFYHPGGERCILWSDPTLAIDWPIAGLSLAVSAKDAIGSPFPADLRAPPQGT